MSDFFKRLKAEEYKALKPIENLVFVNGVAINSEDDLCIACVSWFDRNFGRNKRFNLIHIPNEGKRTRWEALRLQRMGLRSGTPDYLLSKDGVPICWLEFKFGNVIFDLARLGLFTNAVNGFVLCIPVLILRY